MSPTTQTTTPTRRLTVAACEAITQGVANGREWTLFRITAVDGNGLPIDHELRSFERLAPGTSDDFQVERRESDRYGPSYLLKRGRGRLADRVGALEHQVVDHEQRLQAVEAAPPY